MRAAYSEPTRLRYGRATLRKNHQPDSATVAANPVHRSQSGTPRAKTHWSAMTNSSR